MQHLPGFDARLARHHDTNVAARAGSGMNQRLGPHRLDQFGAAVSVSGTAPSGMKARGRMPMVTLPFEAADGRIDLEP